MTLLNRYASHPLRLLSASLKTILLAHVFVTYGYSLVPTSGASMLPTIEVVGDMVLIDKGYRRGRGVVVGDVVSFDSVVQPGERVIKRVIGLEGDFVGRDTPGMGMGVGGGEMLMIPKGHCWVVGDNLPYSRDSRHFGPMPMALIKGKVVAKVFPWKERKWIENGLEVVQ
ncbi:signal peptidase-like protein I [Rhexocercosporidium sp. MPI-PUGE-AT-0058]|nr:signal peptidase-like protein I [Rhexocercosporidium sp. MPI-PUGE-AT-0058]